MIVSTRALLLCHQALQDENLGLSLQGIFGEAIAVSTRPGLRPLWLFAHIETDGKPTFGRLHITCPVLDAVNFHFAVPAGHTIASLSAPLQIPIAKDGDRLTISVVDEFSRTKPMKQHWRLRIEPDAEVLSDQAAAALLSAGVDETRSLAARTRSQSPLNGPAN